MVTTKFPYAQLRPYQKECLDTIAELPYGRYLIQMATGLGKTVTFTSIPCCGKMLIMSHRREIIEQTAKYFDCKVSIEMAKHHADHKSDVIIASVQTLQNRLKEYKPDEFDIIIVDEAHHAAAASYRKILNHFTQTKFILGFTATPNRTDNVRLTDAFDKIVFSRDIKWAIENKYLCDIKATVANIGYDLSQVRTYCGDFSESDLCTALKGTEKVIADVYDNYAKGQTLIFATSVEHCIAISNCIDGAAYVTGKTPADERTQIVNDFKTGKIKCLVNCGVFTEGTDLPCIETIIMARPTQSESLYTQMIGRGLRLYEGKEYLNVIDCVGVTGRHSLCTTPSLLGFEPKRIISTKKEEQMPTKETSCFADNIKFEEPVLNFVADTDIWANRIKYNTHNMDVTVTPSKDIIMSAPDNKIYKLPHADKDGNTVWNGRKMPMQTAIDELFTYLNDNFSDKRHLWLKSYVTKWGSGPASDKQVSYITILAAKNPRIGSSILNEMHRLLAAKKFTKMKASHVINLLKAY